MDEIKVKTTRFNLFLLIVMAASYGISPLITEFVSILTTFLITTVL
jgi:hypothetical protein